MGAGHRRDTRSVALGGLLHAASSTYQMAKMFAPAIILAAMGIAIDGLLTYLERRVLKRYSA